MGGVPGTSAGASDALFGISIIWRADASRRMLIEAFCAMAERGPIDDQREWPPGFPPPPPVDNNGQQAVGNGQQAVGEGDLRDEVSEYMGSDED